MQGGICYECKNKKKYLPYERPGKCHYPSDRYGVCCHRSCSLLIKAAKTPGYLHLAALAVFILSMICLYGASTLYHTLNISPVINKRLRKLDHMMIFVLIAGTYTPVCLIVLGDHTGWNLLGLVWGIALVGIIINALWITCPKWFSSLIYIVYGLDLHPGDLQDHCSASVRRLCMVTCRRYHLHSWRHHLRPETAYL